MDSFLLYSQISNILYFRERFIRLQHENKILKLRQAEETNNEQILILQANCDQLKDQNNQLTNDLWYDIKTYSFLISKNSFLRMSNQKILELEITLKDTTSLAENSTELTDLKKSLNRAVTRHEEESTRAKSQIDELQKRLDNTGKSIQSYSSI